MNGFVEFLHSLGERSFVETALAGEFLNGVGLVDRGLGLDVALEAKVEMAIALCDGLAFRLIANPTIDRERIARAIADVIVR